MHKRLQHLGDFGSCIHKAASPDEFVISHSPACVVTGDRLGTRPVLPTFSPTAGIG